MVTTNKANVIHITDAAIEIFIEGMGTRCEEGGSPIYLEQYDGKWVLNVWSDINQEDPTHQIDMTGAFESLLLDRSEVVR